jgi:UDP-glucose 4-epimerase
MTQILVTGANGFVGSALCRRLQEAGEPYVGAVRGTPATGQQSIGNLDGTTDWKPLLAGRDVIIHCAARVHVMSDKERDPLPAYREVNVRGTLNLARQAVAAGVKRFVFVSSIKVNGEATTSKPFTALDRPAPCDPYGQSKLEAELALQQLGRETGLEIVIVRPPLVYGPGVKANFLNLIKLVRLGLPLPFGCATGRRSMVAVDNLVDLLIHCSSHPNAPGGTFMVSDGEDLSVGELVRLIAQAMEKKVLLLPVPTPLMHFAARLLGASALTDRLLGSLQVDITNTRERLDWAPVVQPQEAIRKTVSAFMQLKNEKN